MARRYIKLALAGVGITSYEDLEGFPKRWYMDWLWHDPLAAPHPIWMTFSVWPTGRGWTPSR